MSAVPLTAGVHSNTASGAVLGNQQVEGGSRTPVPVVVPENVPPEDGIVVEGGQGVHAAQPMHLCPAGQVAAPTSHASDGSTTPSPQRHMQSAEHSPCRQSKSLSHCSGGVISPSPQVGSAH